MRIGIDAYPLARNGAGISNYLFNIIKQLEQVDLENEYFLYSCPGIKLPFMNNARWHIRIKKGFVNKSATLWMQVASIEDLKKDRIDIFWAPEQIAPLSLPKNIKLFLNIHDLSWIYLPKTMSLHNNIFHKLFLKKSIRRADCILTLSNSIVNDLKNNFNFINSDKIKVISPGISEDFRILNKEGALKNIEKIFSLRNKKYILSVGTIEPRKNIATLIKAYNLLDESTKDEYQMLIVGKFGWKYSDLFRLYRQLKLDESQVKFLGYVTKNDLINLYCASALFIFPSLYEGFGLPLLEAMACGVPILCSDMEVFREIVGDSAFFVDTKNEKRLCETIKEAISDYQMQTMFVENGLERKKIFSWNKTAQQLISLFNFK